MKRSGCYLAANCIQSADQARIPASRELVLRIEEQCVEALAKQALRLAPGKEELHLDTIDLSVEYFDRLSRMDLNLVRMNAESQPVEQMDCELASRTAFTRLQAQPHTSSV